MRHVLALIVSLSAGVAQASPRVLVVGPSGDAGNAMALRQKLPGMLSTGCGYSTALVEVTCTDMRCAAEALLNAKADMVLEATLVPGAGDTSTLELGLSVGQRLDLVGKSKSPLNMVGDGVARVCQQATARAKERSLEPVTPKAVTEAEVANVMKDNAFEVHQCAERAWSGAEKETAKGAPILLDWVVRGDGTTLGGSVASPAQNPHSSASDCFARVISHWQFPGREHAVVVRGYVLNVDPANPAQPKPPGEMQKTLMTEDIGKGVQANVEKLGPCITAARQRKEIKAARYAFVLDWKVLPSGATTDPKVKGPSEVLRTTIPACFEKAMLGWMFRRTREGTTVVNFPLPITAK